MKTIFLYFFSNIAATGGNFCLGSSFRMVEACFLSSGDNMLLFGAFAAFGGHDCGLGELILAGGYFPAIGSHVRFFC